MDILTNQYRRNPNEKIHSLYQGVASNGRTVTSIVRPSADMNRMERTQQYGAGLPRGVGGRVGILVLGGMETSLDEMEYILEAKRERKFVPRRGPGEIASMCRLLTERRNTMIEAARKFYKGNPSEMPKRKRRVVLHLPVGFRFVPTSEPGLQIAARV